MSQASTSPVLASLSQQLKDRLADVGGATALTDQDVESIYAAGYELAEVGQYAEAARLVTIANVFRPADLRYQRGRAVLLGKLGQHEEALTLYRALDALEPCNPSNLMGMVDAALGMKLPRLAANLLEQFVRWCELKKQELPELVKARSMLSLLHKAQAHAS